KHAWHSELWNKRLPELREMNPERLTQPANDAVVRFMDAVAEPEAPDQTIEKLVGVYRVLIPRKIAAYTYHLNATSPITDAPTIRWLKFILTDEFDDWREGEMLLQSLIRTPEDVEPASVTGRSRSRSTSTPRSDTATYRLSTRSRSRSRAVPSRTPSTPAT